MSTRYERAEAVKSLHQKRREAGKCIYDNSDRTGGEPHGTPHRGGRCEACWKKKIQSQKANPTPAPRCPSCSVRVGRHAKFCIECGAALGVEVPAPLPTARTARLVRRKRAA